MKVIMRKNYNEWVLVISPPDLPENVAWKSTCDRNGKHVPLNKFPCRTRRIQGSTLQYATGEAV